MGCLKRFDSAYQTGFSDEFLDAHTIITVSHHTFIGDYILYYK